MIDDGDEGDARETNLSEMQTMELVPTIDILIILSSNLKLNKHSSDTIL